MYYTVLCTVFFFVYVRTLLIFCPRALFRLLPFCLWAIQFSFACEGDDRQLDRRLLADLAMQNAGAEKSSRQNPAGDEVDGGVLVE